MKKENNLKMWMYAYSQKSQEFMFYDIFPKKI